MSIQIKFSPSGQNPRTMEMKVDNALIYHSSFDQKTGAIVRIAETEPKRKNYKYYDTWNRDKQFEQRFPQRKYSQDGFSPVPETVDVSITDKCGFGCDFCYQDSQPNLAHAPKEIVEKIISGFLAPPYQMALGGGEPTLHPDFPWILRRVRALGTVPNYTTNGEALKPAVVEATNEVCGGVAMTFHGFKGIDWFVQHYCALKEALKVQVNVHLIADKDVATNLNLLVSKLDQIGPLKLVLLAYYPDVGRAKLDRMLPRRVYEIELPEALKAAQKAGYLIAFSEGLLPYFLSRPELGVNTQFAMRSEGRFSCYFSPRGRISHSSFNPPDDIDPEKNAEQDKEGWLGKTVFQAESQTLWEDLNYYARQCGSECYYCDLAPKCATPHEFHFLACAFAKHNKRPMSQLKSNLLPIVGQE